MLIPNILGDHIGDMELVDRLGSDATIVNAARVSFGKRINPSDFDLAPPDEHGIRQKHGKDSKLLSYLARHRHMSPFRQVQLQVRFKAPIFVARQAMTHKVGIAQNEISGRYVELPDEVYIPPRFRKQSTSNKQGSGEDVDDATNEVSRLEYESAVREARRVYISLLEEGVAKELARNVLPVAQYTEWIWTMSLEAAIHFIRLRDDHHAQLEIQHYARALRKLCDVVAPLATRALLGILDEDAEVVR